MLKHAVVGVDFSSGWEAVRNALPPLARRLGVQHVTLAYVMEIGYPAAPELAHEDYYRDRLEELAAPLRQEGLEVDVTVVVGRPARALQDTARAVGGDCVVLGSRGHSAWREFFLGSSVMDAARTTTLPLVIVPVDGAMGADGPILLATDGSANSAAAEAAFLELVQQGQQGIAMHAGPKAGESSARAVEAGQAAQRLEALAARGVTTFHSDADPREAMKRMARDERASLIVLGKRGHNPLTELLVGSTAEAVCRRSGVPVLLVPAHS
ncbi:universal stress protein [Aquisalimonas sp.]|uniref:universal stress protein n=1 Tax=Aquisalimonas sp. TaxID=1872621 RepID=UPI0025C6D243|nr:universal stress protein [Aquisalimonas sp.]